MSSDFAKQCGSCRFWERWGTDAGGCHRLPPIRPSFSVTGRSRDYERIEVSMQSDSKPIWPNTEQTDWCGEYSAMTISEASGA